jgi:hypothetical protein
LGALPNCCDHVDHVVTASHMVTGWPCDHVTRWPEYIYVNWADRHGRLQDVPRNSPGEGLACTPVLHLFCFKGKAGARQGLHWGLRATGRNAGPWCTCNRGTGTPEQSVSSGWTWSLGARSNAIWAAWGVVSSWPGVCGAGQLELVCFCVCLPAMHVLGRAGMLAVCLQGPRRACVLALVLLNN